MNILEELESNIDANQSVDIYFSNLDAVIQKKIMEMLTEELKVTSDDDYANKKIVDKLSKTALITLNAKDIINKVDFEL